MSALSVAIRQERWDVAACLLLIGLARAAERVPPEALAELMQLLERGDDPGQRP